MVGFTPGSFVQGMEAGQTRQNKQEALKMQKDNHIMKQGQFAMQQEAHGQAMSLRDEQIQALEDKNEAFQYTVNNQERVKGQNITTEWDYKNPQKGLNRLNELGIVAKKGALTLATDDAAKNYIMNQGYEKDYFEIDEETGKVEHFDQQKREDLRKTASGRIRLDKMLHKAEEDFNEAATSMMPYLVTSNDGSKTVSIDDIASIIGSKGPKSFNDMMAKKAGMLPPEANRQSRMDSYQQSMTAFIQGNGARPEDATQAAEWDKKWAKHNQDFATKSVAGMSEVSEQRSLDDLRKNRATGGRLLEAYTGTYSTMGKAEVAMLNNLEDSNMANMQPTEKTSYEKKRTDVNTGERTIKSIERLISSADTLKKENKYTDRGIIDNMINSSLGVLGINNVPDDVKADLARKIKLDTRTGAFVAQFTKDMTGLSATEGERKMYREIILGGDWSDFASLQVAVKEFKATLVENQMFKLADIRSKLPATYADLYSRYDYEPKQHGDFQAAGTVDKEGFINTGQPTKTGDGGDAATSVFGAK